MALHQNIDVLKLVHKMIDLSEEDGSRMCLLDVAVFLHINKSGEIGKVDLNEIIFEKRENKSSMDRPIKRLLSHELITTYERPQAASKWGEARRIYKISKKGNEFLKKCYR